MISFSLLSSRGNARLNGVLRAISEGEIYGAIWRDYFFTPDG